MLKLSSRLPSASSSFMGSLPAEADSQGGVCSGSLRSGAACGACCGAGFSGAVGRFMVCFAAAFTSPSTKTTRTGQPASSLVTRSRTSTTSGQSRYFFTMSSRQVTVSTPSASVPEAALRKTCLSMRRAPL